MSVRALDDRLAPYRVGRDGPFGLDEAIHLARRVECGATPARMAALAAAGLEGALDEVLSDAPASPAEAGLLAMGARIARRGDTDALAAAWLLRFLGERPWREHLALFWHDHFATSQDKVADLVAMEVQNRILLESGAGPFAALLERVAKDPAMLLWLDQAASTPLRPNENFARELFELFTLGRGHYAESDVLEAARALTGWSLRGGRFAWRPEAHDAGEKTILGERGAFDGDAVLAIAVAAPRRRRFIAEKLCRWFVREEIDEELGSGLAALMEEAGDVTAVFLRRLLASRLFFSEAARGALVRNPVQLAVGALRTLDARVATTELARRVADLGLALFRPPSVEGWRNGTAWLDSAGLVGRQNLGVLIAEGEDGPLRVRSRLEPETEGAAVFRAFLGRAPDEEDRRLLVAAHPDPRALVGALMQEPEAQLH
ncbi:MAG: DUF1800 family protein [Planctomycetota bacterium]